ncbi:hypothetical protein FIBSPDRAFT_883715 [Athelia psychrophila]|uniref:Uncharacterized protein n=1 Tax=Athelia psychrophila TaxID=1759441 RepID=A0A166TUZ0_9AGAM|nr:hypothetical protein FIBSPDRAFT_883715 [Fibularhizoctonia sp. CBS 109695]
MPNPFSHASVSFSSGAQSLAPSPQRRHEEFGFWKRKGAIKRTAAHDRELEAGASQKKKKVQEEARQKEARRVRQADREREATEAALKAQPAQEKAARQEEVRRARQAEQEARIVELAKEEAAVTIQHINIVFDFTDVTFNAGLAIQHVLLGFESYRIMFKNLIVESRVYLWIHRPSVAALEANTGKHAKHGQTSHKFTHSMLLDLVPLVRFQHDMCGCGSVSPYRRRLRRVSRCKITDLRFSMATVAPTAVSHLRLAAAVLHRFYISILYHSGRLGVRLILRLSYFR